MGAVQHAAEDRESMLDVDIDFEGSSSSTSSGSDVEGHVFGAIQSSRGLQRSVEVAPSFSKRTYGVNQVAYESTSMERMRKCAKLDEQLDGLRALLPHSTRRRERNDPSVVMDAYRYIVALQQEVEDLSAELLECEADSCDQESTFKLHRSKISYQQPLVEVMKRDGVMEVRIVCPTRPGLLVDVMEAVEARGLTITQARIACYKDNNNFKYLSLEIEESAIMALSTEGGSEEADSEEDLDTVKAMLVDAICEGNLRYIDSDLQ
ncbi:hypothetical protein KC19_8G065300 [Ceratodon purpureus]|uniref:ACT domain-containing protein n=1 Tax=Ceratodon purpureus TaxID=3225 RepID=A0A8T0H0D5_CERPU|nr:hypothetical protein KC19_8G065300 [Ceratodon purpureus]